MIHASNFGPYLYNFDSVAAPKVSFELRCVNLLKFNIKKGTVSSLNF